MFSGGGGEEKITQEAILFSFSHDKNVLLV